MYNDNTSNENVNNNENNNVNNSYYTGYYNPDFTYSIKNTSEERNPKTRFMTKKLAVVMLVVCMVLSTAIGFGGGLFATGYFNGNAVLPGSTPKDSVIYQSVIRTVSDTSAKNDKITTPMSISDVVNKTANSVVEITTETKTTGPVFRQYIAKGAGSGVIITADGYIVTNNHVIDGAGKINVKLKSGETRAAALVGKDSQTDLALLKINATGLTPAVYGDSSKIAVGETAIVIGNPLGELGGTVTSGIISALDREINIDGQTMTLLQTDASVNPGNSGGALMNSYGELVGIINAKSSGSGIEGLGFAIPINTVKPIIDQLMNNGYVKGRIQVGLSLVDVDSPQTAAEYGVNRTGVYVSDVKKLSAAEKAGFQPGDLIISVDNNIIDASSDIKKVFDSHKVGDTLNVVVRRESQVTLKLTLSEYKPE